MNFSVATDPVAASRGDTPPLASGPLNVSGLDIEVIVSAGRRGVRLTIERDARVTAAVPAGLDADQLTELVKGRRRWIYSKLEDRAAAVASRPTKRFITGEGFSYLGRSYRLKFVAAAPAPVQLIHGRFQIHRDRHDSASADLIDWYRAHGQAWLPGRAAPWAQRLRVPWAQLTVRKLGYRWGSCSPRGTVNIHWATMQLPIALVDYVLVHEFAHLQHHDHSTAFWRVVERAMPDYEVRRARLDDLGAQLWLPDANN
ncbi:M48 family metallopeptidase [Streptomyces sp. S1]|uniref:M48 family metallopeptidase n=1 Tax=Streptomyces sp. S1 TaxID=718288 RepID=UPI000EF844BE|nr:SprT family zinc-dependent metalloprotease [Streptomyces sp. S1]